MRGACTLAAILVAVICGLMLVTHSAAQAATVALSTDSECKVDISGPILPGDYDKLVALKSEFVINDGESTRLSVACLDSPGGGLTEGLRIARFFLDEGVGTRIRADSECYSICAVIFMMGNYTGAEVRGLSRVMHVNGSLGFHRPYLSLEEAKSYSAGDIEVAYDLGINSVFDLLTLANQRVPWGADRLMEPDLVGRMTGTPGDQLFLVTTVEQALRWEIEIEGVAGPSEIGKAQLLFACEYALADQVALPTELAGDGLLSFDIFRLTPLNSYAIKEAVDGPVFNVATDRYRVQSLRNGYSVVGCEVEDREKYVEVCGIDESTNTAVGDCERESGALYVPRLALYHPASSLKALSLITSNPPDAATLVRCRVISVDDITLDDQICLQQVLLLSDDAGQAVRHLIDWPSGTRTVVEILAESGDREVTVTINGQQGRAREGSNDESCILNISTGNTLCLGALQL